MRRTAVALTALLVAAACGGGTDAGGEAETTLATTTTSSTTTTTTAPDTTTTTEAGQSTSTEPEMMEGVHVAETAEGAVLVDPDGFALYIFTNDGEGESTCYDACAETWPPVPADTPIGSELEAGIFGSTARDDGSEQLTINGMPLYRYAPDQAPGDVNGQGVGGVWFLVSADGSPLDGSASTQGGGSSEEEETGDFDYDY